MQKDKTKVLSFFVKRYKVLKKNTDIFSVKNLENFAKILVMQKKGISYMQILKVGNLKKVLEENTGKILNDFKGIECKVIGKNFVICKSEGEKKDNLKTVLEDINRYFIKEKENNNYQSLLSKNVVINIYDDYYYAKDIKEENGNLVFVRFISSI